MKHRLALFLSGSGSNARAICTYFQGHPDIEVVLLLSNKVNSGAASISDEFHIPYRIFNREEFYQSTQVLDDLKTYSADVIALAGFLWLIPDYLLEAYPDRILNIHPALLPKYGGKGMHGKHVHQVVWENKEKESGITIHLCNPEYDKGSILYQEKVALSSEDMPATIEAKVRQLELRAYPKVIEAYCSSLGG